MVTGKRAEVRNGYMPVKCLQGYKLNFTYTEEEKYSKVSARMRG